MEIPNASDTETDSRAAERLGAVTPLLVVVSLLALRLLPLSHSRMPTRVRMAQLVSC
jgi:hypothetical protein